MFINYRKYAIVRVALAAVLLAGLFNIQPTHAQTIGFGWAQRVGGPFADWVSAMALDSNGNVFAIGGKSTTNADILVSKLDANGDLVWSREIGASSHDDGRSIAVDTSGNPFITGVFSGTVDFDPGVETFELTSAGLYDVFISKWDNNGDFVWAKRIGGGPAPDSSYDIALDSSGNVYTLGSFFYTVDFDPGPGIANLTSASDKSDIFISKLDSNGDFIWAKSISGIGEEFGLSVATDTEGNVYTTGSFLYTVDFDPGLGVYNLTAADESYGDIFVSKWDSNGDFVWAKSMAAATTSGIYGANGGYGTAIAIDANGNVYTTGTFRGTVDFDPGTSIYNLTSLGEYDTFVSKIDNEGRFVWAKQIGVAVSEAGDSIALDADNNVYMTGWFQLTADFDPGIGEYNMISAGAADIFVSKLDNNGNFVWAKRMGGAGPEGGDVIAVDSDNNIYIAGGFFGTVDFDPGAGTNNLTSAGEYDIFVTKLAAVSQVYYVKQNAAGNNNGSSWNDAYTDLQSALSAASSGNEIWVAAGTYKPTSTTDRTISFALKNGVAVYGGFAGTETARDQRDPTTNLTILSGDIDDNDSQTPIITDIMTVTGNNTNSYHVVTGADNAILDGFTITAGYADGAFSYHSGAGLYNDAVSPTLANLTFSGNWAYDGGGMGNTVSSPSLTNVIFSGNFASTGGGMSIWDSNPSLTTVNFSGNTASDGGGMSNYGGSPSLMNVTFDGNNASSRGGGMYIQKGGPSLTNATFSGNTAHKGGGIYNGLGNPALMNVSFSDNIASNYGGGLYNDLGSTSLNNVTFSNNTAGYYGGGMENNGGSPTLTNVTFDSNHANAYGGGMYNWGDSRLTNVTFSKNTATRNGGGVFNNGGTPVIINSILYGNANDQIYEVTGSLSVTYSIVQGGYAGEGNLDEDPLLGPLQDNGGFTQTMALGAGSPAIDSGDDLNCPATDQRGITRPQGTRCDVGAYEAQFLVRYVKQDATGANDGSSWEDAYTDLQAALAAASPDEEIWVAAGTYKPTSGTDRTATFQLKSGVAIYGGFAGTETARDQRDPTTNLTILSGDIDHNDSQTPIITDITTVTGTNTNSHHVVMGANDATLDGFTITAGNVNGSAIRDGGGLYNNNSSPTLANLTFSGNLAYNGGGMGNTGSSPTLTNVTFLKNLAGWAGGGLYNNNSSPTLVNVTFGSNTAATGGGMSNESSSNPILTDVRFSENTAQISGGGMQNDSSGATLTHVTFYQNQANSSGFGGAIFKSGPGELVIRNSTITQNQAGNGGGAISNSGSGDITIVDTTIAGNQALQGGAIDNMALGDITIVNSTITENQAVLGGAIAIGGSNLSVYNSTFASNIGSREGSELYTMGTVNINFYNTILACIPGFIDCFVSSETTSIGYISSIVDYGTPADFGLAGLADNGGPTQTMALLPGSPLIDAGDDSVCANPLVNSLDQRGVTRPQGSHCDIGAYEYDGQDSTIRVNIGNSGMGSYLLSPNQSLRRSYLGINNGPVKVINTHGFSIMASERAIYKVGNVAASFSEMMGLPSSQVDTAYWLPWYNSKDLNTQLRIANVSMGEATVHVSIGGVPVTGSPFTLAAGASIRKSFPNVDKGPVKIESNVEIVAAERVIYRVNGVDTSYSEMMALPAKQVDTTYWLPWYNSKDLDTQLRIANVSGSTATVHVSIGGTPVTGSPFTIPAGMSIRRNFPDVDKGPVKIESNVDIVAAERVIYKVNNVPVSFSETMALPNSQVDTIFHLPWYNSRSLNTQLRIANVSPTDATVHISIGGTLVTESPFTIPAGGSKRLSFPNIDKGPVQIESNVDIIASERVIYTANGKPTSFSELMGLPNALLDNLYWFPWYNNKDLNTQLRFGVP